jgi:murein DD-endopeptidase MepM/ murein hydrolase activator NlpD
MVSSRVVHATVVALAVLALGASAAAQSAPSSSARAFGVRVLLPDGTVASSAPVSAPPRKAATVDGWSYGEGAVVSGWTSTAARSGVGAQRSTATGSASVRSVSLFGGEITVDGVFMRASARASGTGASGDLSASSLSNLVVLGETVRAGQNGRVTLADWGYAVPLDTAVVRKQGSLRGYRGFVTGLHVVLTDAHGGLPAGTEIMVGYAEAAASAPRPKPAPPPAPAPPSNEPVPPSAPQVPPSVKPPPPNVTPKLTAAGYVFPIYGPASTSDSFGAPRTTTWHHGVDIFAPLGAPLLAVADGTLFRVGWNDVGGNRLWLRDGAGNEFYYAHLSAFSPLAEEGAQVKAGDVIGFVGTTGDAAGTPPHLHFEIHPAAMAGLGYDGVVAPYSILLAWRRADDISFAAGRIYVPVGPGSVALPAPGAVLLEADDIGSTSGLVPGALEKALNR